MWPTPRWPRSPGPLGWPRERSRPSSTAAARPWPSASRPAGRTTMLEERLQRAAGALERSVAEVDAAARLQALGRRRHRQRTTTTAVALIVTAAVLAGVVFGVGIARRSHPPAVPVVGPDPTAPARVVESLRLFGDPVAMAVRADDVWVAGDNPTWVTRWVTPTNPMTHETPTIALPAAPTRLAAAEDAVWVLTPADNRVVRIDPATNEVVASVPGGRRPAWPWAPGRSGSRGARTGRWCGSTRRPTGWWPRSRSGGPRGR